MASRTHMSRRTRAEARTIAVSASQAAVRAQQQMLLGLLMLGGLIASILLGTTLLLTSP
jgi:hypothetical protein